MRRDPRYKENAKELRRNMTNGEKVLWERLRAHRMDGRKFRRQHAIGSYIVDFVCLQSRLIIEIDGDSHYEDSRPRLDEQRTAYLERVGFRVRRFGNHQVMTELASVTEAIWMELQADVPSFRPSPQPSPRGGEGGFPQPSPPGGEGDLPS